jgi:ABC-type antimicrobial peptide transport system permease subunit
MLTKHLYHKFLSYKEFNIYNLVFIFISVLTIFLMISFRDVSVAKIESSITFNEQTALVTTNFSSSYYPNGFYFSDNEVEQLKVNYEHTTLIKSTEITSTMRQNISFSAITSDFLETGVTAFDYRYSNVITQKIELLYGNIWDTGMTDPVVVIDETTAMNLFGFYNVIGEKIETSLGNFEVIGVVSDTLTREQIIEKSIEAGQAIDPYIYYTQAYIPYCYYKTIINNSVLPDFYIIYDESMSDKDLKEDISHRFNISDSNVLVTRSDMIQRKIMDNETYFLVITSITSVLAVLGVINFINVATFFFSIFKRNNAIYRVVGATKKRIIYINFLEIFFTSLIGCITSLVLGVISLFTISLFLNNLAYIRILYLLRNAGIILISVLAITSFINVLVSILFIKSSYSEELRDVKI